MTRFKSFSNITRALKNQSGIGLTESLVAIAILGVSAISFITSLASGAISVKTLDQAAMAQQLLTSQMETLKAMPYDATGQSYTVINAPEGYRVTLEVNSNIYSDPNLQHIIAVVWHQNTPLSQLESFRTNR